MNTTQAPTLSTRNHRPYYSPEEVDILSEKQRGKLSLNQEEKARQRACSLIEAVGTRIGFPRKTIATSQNLYHRLHLNFSRKHFEYPYASLAALYVSSKMHDTLKKPQDILMVYYVVQSPELAARSRTMGGEVDVKPDVIEQDRQRILSVERYVLETICFNFTSRMPFPYVIKIARQLQASKGLAKLAWRLAVDAQRSLAPLIYPPHEIALASLYVASFLAPFQTSVPGPVSSTDVGGGQTRTPQEMSAMLSTGGAWEQRFHAHVEDVDEAAHVIIDVLIHSAQNPHSTNASPSTPTSPSSVSGVHLRTQSRPSMALPVPYTPDQLTQLKISMREAKALARTSPNYTGHGRPARLAQVEDDIIESVNENGSTLGRDKGTIRFMFGPNVQVGEPV